ncbi:hypothetical protein J4G43_052940 (plasmid) [Bradyrhizobium barranii subsp. barranii]|uniref:Uncharacterized protein n=1 Tax=Bradyrhizobium barranii subsp. barranii TaxID=2823807 RepID=A0A939MNG9_9BRAD|nr:hypothetical protein [Bradyrhizobium barranii]UEM17932.1 hypothetical protein J4G43_052940 [Bradyrhizobium barranii subsp. barranii]
MMNDHEIRLMVDDALILAPIVMYRLDRKTDIEARQILPNDMGIQFAGPGMGSIIKMSWRS